MYTLYIIFISISIVFAALRKYSKDKSSEKLLAEYEKDRPSYNQLRVLPHSVSPLLVEHSNIGKLRLTLTPTHFEQTDESVFSIPVQAKYDEGRIGFEIALNATPIKDEDMTKDEEGITGVFLETNSELADNFLKVLAHLFEVELSDKAQIVKGLFLFSEEETITTESLYEGHEFILFFGDKNPSDTTPAIRLTINLNVGTVVIEEIDPIFRPIIIDRLTFKPNIRN